METVAGVAAAAALAALLSRRRAQKEKGPKPLNPAFGTAIRSLFPTDQSFTHLNHGSYGVAPKEVMAHAHEIMDGIEAFPDDFFRRTALPRFRAASEKVAEFLKAEPGSLVFVDNATTGVNTVLRSFPLSSTDAILINDNTYNAVKNAVYDRAANTGAKVVSYTVTLPVPTEGERALVDQFARVLDAHPNITLAIIDHITSPTGIVMPVAAMVKEAKRRGVRILIDGAHAPGQLALDLTAIGADWYTGNLHKWCYTLKGVAVLVVGKDVQDMTQGPVISHFWRKSLHERFYMQGTNDQSRYLSAPFALQWVQDRLGGWQQVRDYNSTLARTAADMLCARWGTGVLLPASLSAPFLICIEYPLDWKVWVRTSEGRNCAGWSDEQAEAALAKDEGYNERVATALFHGWRLQSQAFTWKVGGKVRLYCRISAQVYNCMEDYERLAQAVLELKQQTEGKQ